MVSRQPFQGALLVARASKTLINPPPPALYRETGTAITRNELIGKRVYTPDAGLVGEVTDVAFSIGANQPSLVVKGPDGRTAEIPWSSVGAAKDIVLIKERVDATMPKSSADTGPSAAPQAQTHSQTPATSAPGPGGKRFCPSCGKPLTWIKEYNRWYCYPEKKYV